MHFIIGLPVRATSNQEMSCLYVKKDKMADGAPRSLCLSHPCFNVADFCREGTGHFRYSRGQIWKSILNKYKLIAWSY